MFNGRRVKVESLAVYFHSSFFHNAGRLMNTSLHRSSLCFNLAAALIVAIFSSSAMSQTPWPLQPIELASFAVWDDALIRSSGQTFFDVFNDGTGVDITVSAEGTYSESFTPGVSTVYNPGLGQIGTSASNESNRLVFRLNNADIGGRLIAVNETTDARETVQALSLSGETVGYTRRRPFGTPVSTVSPGPHVVEIRGPSQSTSDNLDPNQARGNFVFSSPSTFSITHGADPSVNLVAQGYSVGRIIEDPSRPLPRSANGIPVGEFPFEGTFEGARFPGWNDSLVRSVGQQFTDVFGDGQLDVFVSTRGAFSGDVNRQPEGFGTFLTSGGEFNSLVFQLQPTQNGTFDGNLVVSTAFTTENEITRVAALDGSPIEFQQEVTATFEGNVNTGFGPQGTGGRLWQAERLVDDPNPNTFAVSGSTFGPDIDDGLFVFNEPSSFSLTYTTDKDAGYQFYRIGRIPAEFLSTVAGGIPEVHQHATSSFAAVPEPASRVLWMMGMLLLIRRGRRA